AQGSNQFVRLTVDASFNAGGAIVWDGRYLVVADNPASPKKSDPLTLYQFQLSGSRATLVNTIHLRTGKRNVGAFGMQFAIDGRWLIAPKTTQKNVARWPYPDGGGPAKTFKLASKQFGVTLSR